MQIIKKILLFGLLISFLLTQDFQELRFLKEDSCHELQLNRGFRASENRVELQAESTNFLEGFAKVGLNFFQGDRDTSTIFGLIMPLILPIILLIGFITSMIIFIVYLFPGYFETRKEFVKAWKQKLILSITILVFIGIILSFSLITMNLRSSIEEAKYTNCFFFLIQYDLVAGLNESEYSFIGFDNINTTIQAFQKELINFSSISNALDSIQSQDFNGKKQQPLDSAKTYSQKYLGNQILNYSLTDPQQQSSLLTESLTEFIQEDIEIEFNDLKNTAESLVRFTDYGKKIITTYENAADVLVTSMVFAMNNIVDGFVFIINQLIELDDPISQFISYLNSALIILIIFMILTVIFIPVFAVFYRYTNYSDEYPWAKKMMKGWLVVASILGVIFTVFFLIFLYANIVISGMCFYSNEILTNKDFSKVYKAELGLENEKMLQVIDNCFWKETSTFENFFNQNGQISTDNNQTVQEDIRTKPKIDTENENQTENNTTDTTTTDNSKAPVTAPTSFSTNLLSDFQSFVINYFVYEKFYKENNQKDSPSVQTFYDDIDDYKNGIKYNFPDYSAALAKINELIKCPDIHVASNIRTCPTIVGCFTLKDNTSQELSSAISIRDCIEDKSQVVSIFTALKNSFNSAQTLYTDMKADLNETPKIENFTTPGKAALNLRTSILDISNDFEFIQQTFKNSFSILERYNGNLQGLTNCYIAQRQVTLLETPLCFFFRPKLYSTMLYLLLLNIILLGMVWTVFFSIKYSGNLSVQQFGSKTTQASVWDKSKANVVSFMENSQLVDITQTEEDEDDEDEQEDYFSEDSENEEEDDEDDIFAQK